MAKINDKELILDYTGFETHLLIWAGNSNLVDVDAVRVLPGPMNVRVRVARGLAREQDVVASKSRDVRRPGDEVWGFC